jgi:hypothetical protein
MDSLHDISSYFIILLVFGLCSCVIYDHNNGNTIGFFCLNLPIDDKFHENPNNSL